MNPIFLIIFLALISFVPRVLPFVLSKPLKKNKAFAAMQYTLPSCIMLLLCVHTFREGGGFGYPESLFRLGGVIAVVVAHFLWRKSMVSMLSGFAVYQLLFRIFD